MTRSGLVRLACWMATFPLRATLTSARPLPAEHVASVQAALEKAGIWDAVKGRIVVVGGDADGSVEFAQDDRGPLVERQVIERMLAEMFGMEWYKVHDEAERLEHAVSPDFEAKLLAKLGRGGACPHGNLSELESPTSRRRRGLRRRGANAAPVISRDGEAATKFCDRFFTRLAADFDDVGLRHVRRGFHQLVRERAAASAAAKVLRNIRRFEYWFAHRVNTMAGSMRVT